MKIFEHMNTNGKNGKCYVCGKKDDKPVVLIGIDGTEDDSNVEAVQVHVDCIELRLKKSDNENMRDIFYMLK